MPPTRALSVLTSSNGKDIVLYERWLVIDSLKMVFGASPRFSERLPSVSLRVAITWPAVPIAFKAVGSSAPISVYSFVVFVAAARSSSSMPSCDE